MAEPTGEPRNSSASARVHTKAQVDYEEGAEPVPLSVGALVERWLDLVSDDLSPTTVQSYRSVIDRRIVPALGTTDIRSLAASDLDLFYITLRRAHGLASATVRSTHSILRSCLAQAVKWGLLESNPALKASPPKLRRAEVEPPDLEQVQALIGAAEETNPVFGRLLRLMAATGVRRGEACALRWLDVDFDARTLLIRRALVMVDGRGTMVKSTKTRSIRKIALDSTTLATLKDQHEFMQLRAAAEGVALHPDAYLFSRAVNGSRPSYPGTVSHNFIVLRDRLGFDGVRLHDLRHAHATQLLAAGVPVRTVSGRLGHANAATTLGVYAHFLASSDRDAADVIGELLG